MIRGALFAADMRMRSHSLSVPTPHVASSRTASRKKPAHEGLPNFERVDEHLFRGGQPSRAGLANLKKMGVRTIVDLRERGGPSMEAKHARALGLRYYRIRMGHLIAPGRAAIDRALEIFADPQNRPVYVHCRRGCDRTGTVVACYRIASAHWTAEEAIAEARDRGMFSMEYLKRAFIRRFYRSVRASRSH